MDVSLKKLICPFYKQCLNYAYAEMYLSAKLFKFGYYESGRVNSLHLWYLFSINQLNLTDQ